MINIFFIYHINIIAAPVKNVQQESSSEEESSDDEETPATVKPAKKSKELCYYSEITQIFVYIICINLYLFT